MRSVTLNNVHAVALLNSNSSIHIIVFCVSLLIRRFYFLFLFMLLHRAKSWLTIVIIIINGTKYITEHSTSYYHY